MAVPFYSLTLEVADHSRLPNFGEERSLERSWVGHWADVSSSITSGGQEGKVECLT